MLQLPHFHLKQKGGIWVVSALGSQGLNCKHAAPQPPSGAHLTTNTTLPEAELAKLPARPAAILKGSLFPREPLQRLRPAARALFLRSGPGLSRPGCPVVLCRPTAAPADVSGSTPGRTGPVSRPPPPPPGRAAGSEASSVPSPHPLSPPSRKRQLRRRDWRRLPPPTTSDPATRPAPQPGRGASASPLGQPAAPPGFLPG